MVTTEQKYIIDMQTQKKKESKHNTTNSHEITRKQKKGGKDLQKQIQNN